MSAAVYVNAVEVSPIIVRGQRVLTLAMIDRVHQRVEGTARRNFRENKGRLVEGEDFFVVTRESSMDEIRTLGNVPPKGVTLITESGYLLLVKSFTDDLAWRVQKQLVATYFRVQGKEKSAMESLNDAINAMEKDKRFASLNGLALARWKRLRKEHMVAVEKAQQRVQLLLGF